MKLPTREHFDLDGAAEFLGCSRSDVLYYVKQDQLRLAFNSEHADLIVFNESLPEKAHKALNWFEGAYPQVTLTAKQSSKIKSYVNDWVYYKWFDYAQSRDVNDGQALWQLQDLDGKPVSLWVIDGEKLQLSFEWLKLAEGEPWPESCLLTLAELQRFAGGAVGSVKEPFKLPKKADEVAEAMVAYGNRFYAERGFAPTVKDLQGFMIETGGRDLQMSYDPKGQDFFFGDKPVSKRAFSERYKTYRVEK